MEEIPSVFYMTEELLRQMILEQKATNKLLNDLIQLFLKYDTEYAVQMEKEYGHLKD